MKPLVASLWLACLAALPLGAEAGSTVEIGRVKLVLAEDGWEATEVNLGNAKLDPSRSTGNVGMGGSLEGKAKVLTLRDAERQPVAVLLVYATYGSARNLRMTGECKAIPGLYVHDFTNGRIESPECVILGGPVDSEGILEQGMYRMRDARKIVQFDLPKTALFVDGYFANSTGAMIHVQGLMARPFKGRDGAKPAADLPANLPPALAAWGDALGDASRKALRSFSGELVLPPVEFN